MTPPMRMKVNDTIILVVTKAHYSAQELFFRLDKQYPHNYMIDPSNYDLEVTIYNDDTGYNVSPNLHDDEYLKPKTWVLQDFTRYTIFINGKEFIKLDPLAE